MQQCLYETKIRDIYDLQKRLMQTWVAFKQKVIEAAIDQWRDRLRSWRLRTGGGHVEHMVWIAHLHYVVHQNILWNWQCILVNLAAIS